MDIDFGDVMKKGRKKAERREHDAYMTPMPLVEAIVGELPRYLPVDTTSPLKIVEPSCGDGEFIAALRKHFPSAIIAGIDIREEMREHAMAAGATGFVGQDFLTTPLSATIDLIVGNPPFNLYTQFVEHALKSMHIGARLGFVSRINHLVGSLEAQKWWVTPLPGGLTPNDQIEAVRPIFPRPSFTGGGTDSTEYAFIVWHAGIGNEGRIAPITWEKPTVRRGRPRKNVTPPAGDLFAGER